MYKNFDLNKYLNGPNADPGFIPPRFIYEKLDVNKLVEPEETENKIVKNLIWSAKFYIIGVIILKILMWIIILICYLANK